MVQDRIERDDPHRCARRARVGADHEAEHLGRWFGDAGAEIDLRPGGAMVAALGAITATVHGPRRRGRAAHRFAYRWLLVRTRAAREPRRQLDAAEFTLAAEGDGTRLPSSRAASTRWTSTRRSRPRNVGGNTSGWARSSASWPPTRRGSPQTMSTPRRPRAGGLRRARRPDPLAVLSRSPQRGEGTATTLAARAAGQPAAVIKHLACSTAPAS